MKSVSVMTVFWLAYSPPPQLVWLWLPVNLLPVTQALL